MGDAADESTGAPRGQAQPGSEADALTRALAQAGEHGVVPDLGDAGRAGRGILPTAHPDGPKVVAIGGGHGLSASLRAIRRYAGEVTAIVSMADDGGSTGRLRSAVPDLPAPGDVRKCLGALAEDSSAFGRILEHRIGEGDLAGHTLGNLMLVALAMEAGSFGAAIDELADRVGAVGRVVPATEQAVDLIGWRTDEPLDAVDPADLVTGQVAVHEATWIRQVAISPADAASPAAVAEAIEAADQVVIGPGSLYTSVLAAAVVPAVRKAIVETKAQVVFVANLAPQVPESEGYTVADEVAAVERHGIDVDLVLVDGARSAASADASDRGGASRSRRERVAAGSGTRALVIHSTLAGAGGGEHDPERLAEALRNLFERTRARGGLRFD